MNNQLAYINLIPDNREMFANKVIEISTRLGIQANWLMIVFYIETAAVKFGIINHRIQNSIGATGLIQFMPMTAVGLGTNITALKMMNNIQQLDYVFKYFLPYSGRMKSLADCYLAVLFPAAIGKPDDWVLQSFGLSAEKVACWNPLYDLNQDHRITVGEGKVKLKTFIPPGITV